MRFAGLKFKPMGCQLYAWGLQGPGFSGGDRAADGDTAGVVLRPSRLNVLNREAADLAMLLRYRPGVITLTL